MGLTSRFDTINQNIFDLRSLFGIESMLDGSALAVFLAIVEHGHFVRAADSLGIAQSVASKRLARLEDALGTRLLARGSRTRITLTRAGELFLEEARSALAALDQAERIGQALARGAQGPLKVGYVFSAAMTGVLSRTVRSLRTDLPGLEVLPQLMDTPSQIRALGEGRIDIAMVRPRPSWPARAHVLAVHREAIIIALGEAMPIAGAAALNVPDLVGQTFLTPQFHEEVGLAETVRDLVRDEGLQPPEIRPTSDFITAASLAAAGEGIIVAPASLARLQLAGLAFRPLAGEPRSLDLTVLASRETPAAVCASIRNGLADCNG
jgi:DNA-binding transcriptional LysR family regulator